MAEYTPQPTKPVPIELTGIERWAEKEPSISLKEFREWLAKNGPVTVITMDRDGRFVIEVKGDGKNG